MSRILSKPPKENIFLARQLRKSGNPAEKFLWNKLCRNQFFGLKFRKQVPFGPYVLDFLCVSKKIVIEIDGDSHYTLEKEKNDRKRDLYLTQRGLKIIRVGHKETLKNIDGILEKIRMMLGLEYH